MKFCVRCAMAEVDEKSRHPHVKCKKGTYLASPTNPPWWVPSARAKDPHPSPDSSSHFTARDEKTKGKRARKSQKKTPHFRVHPPKPPDKWKPMQELMVAGKIHKYKHTARGIV